jgi:dTDP-4-amino-4,6-dideoxygalactose transaminase
MRSEFLPFAQPLVGDEEIQAVVECLRSGWLTTGMKVKQFEKEFAAYLTPAGAEPPHALAVNSCTAALHLALEAVGVGPGDEVVTTPMTFTATAAVIEHLGATPVFADIDPVTLNLDPREVERRMSPRTKAIRPGGGPGRDPRDRARVRRAGHRGRRSCAADAFEWPPRGYALGHHVLQLLCHQEHHHG